MKIAVCVICALLSSECSLGQEYSRIDSMSILFQVYNLRGFEKQVFRGSQTLDTSIYIMYKPIGKNLKVGPPTHDKYEYLNIYFYPRSYVIGFGITHWMVIDTLSIVDSKANLVYRIVSSSDSWDVRKDVTYLVGHIKLEFQNRAWVVVRERTKRM